LLTLSATERKKRENWHCTIPSHKRANGIHHSTCYDNSLGIAEKVGYLDIETSNLSSDFGCILSYCIKEDNGRIHGRTLTPSEIKNGVYDKELLREFCQEITHFTRVITYYGLRFDIPFLRSRCLLYHLSFPIYKQILHTDAYFVVRHKLGTLHSRRLGVVAPFYGIVSKEHPLNPTIWLKCLSGNKRALNFVFTHNKEDVVSLEKLWHKINKYTRLNKTSI
jgi:uncharacterized protein YprB with RNaseH-like and TPR domain